MLRRLNRGGRLSERWGDGLLEVLEGGHRTASWEGGNLYLPVVNSVTAYRAKTVFSKEPETIRWIESMSPSTSVLWDVGANVGLYSSLAAVRGIRVVAFEPSIANLEVFQTTIFKNDLTERVVLIPVAIAGSVQLLNARLPTRKLGRGSSAPFLMALNESEPSINFNTVAFNLDSVREFFGVAAPTHLKIDVDGGEEAILLGGASTLADVKSILIEVADNEESQNAVRAVLSGLGFEQSRVSARMNQLWERPD